MLTDGGVLQCAALRENGPFSQQTQIAGRRARQGSEDDQILYQRGHLSSGAVE